MLIIGCHLSSSKGYLAMGRQAQALHASTFQFFTRNPRGSRAKAVNEGDIAAYLAFARAAQIGPVVAHAPYTLNPASADPHLRELALQMMVEDLDTLEKIPGTYYNFHPGSHVGQGADQGIAYITDTLNQVLDSHRQTWVLLETMSGKGSEVGASFEELARIMDGVGCSDKLGVCLDTCHVYSAGYDIVRDLDGVLEHFDRVLGLDKLKALHLNDSMTAFGSHKDRHEKISLGSLGEGAFAAIVNHPQLCRLPMVLETPNDLPGYEREIARLRQLARDKGKETVYVNHHGGRG